MNLDVLFQGWASIGRVLIIAAVIYVAVAAVLRIAGVRALAKMSAYDLIVTIALGSLVATIPLNESVSISEGLAAIITLLALQYLTSWVLKRWQRTRRIIEDSPRLLVWEGEMLPGRMEDARVTTEEIRAAVRAAGLGSVSQAIAVVLENDGNWSVVDYEHRGNLDAFLDLDLPASPASVNPPA
jgi:uncharacterized membrane protein YcaP (DUF421 family)